MDAEKPLSPAKQFPTILREGPELSAEDSSNLIDTPAAGKLGFYRAYFYSEDEARLEKCRL